MAVSAVRTVLIVVVVGAVVGASIRVAEAECALGGHH